jgi:hypothetical protein
MGPGIGICSSVLIFCRFKFFWLRPEGPTLRAFKLLFQISFHMRTHIRIRPCAIFIHIVLNLVWWCPSLRRIAFMLYKEPSTIANSCFVHSDFSPLHYEPTHSCMSEFFCINQNDVFCLSLSGEVEIEIRFLILANLLLCFSTTL